MPIIVDKIKPFAVHTSTNVTSRFSANVDSARNYFHRQYDSFTRYSNDKDHVFFYRIEKINTKKKNTKKKQTSALGNKVVKREVVRKKEVKLYVYKFARKNIVKSEQFLNHFSVNLKF